MHTLKPQHQTAIDRLVEHFSQDPNFSALIIGGSIARGFERDNSDVDIILVASPEEMARRHPQNDYHYFSTEFCDYPGGYIDGKVVDIEFLEEVAHHGSEPARSAFTGAFIACSRITRLQALLDSICIYPEAERAAKISSFYAQVQALQWYVGEAEKLANPYLMMHVVSNLVLFGGRMVLAYNRILYPYHKWFLEELRRAPQKPDGLMEQIDELLRCPDKAAADRFCNTVLHFTDWEKPAEGWPARFMQDSEWNWRNARPPLADW